MTTNENERDAAADLAVCEAATPEVIEIRIRRDICDEAEAFIPELRLVLPDSITDEQADRLVLSWNKMPHWIARAESAEARAAELERDLAGARGALTDLNNQLRVNVEHLNVVLAERDEAREHLADARSLVALKQQDVDSLARALADERRAREAAEVAVGDNNAVARRFHDLLVEIRQLIPMEYLREVYAEWNGDPRGLPIVMRDYVSSLRERGKALDEALRLFIWLLGEENYRDLIRWLKGDFESWGDPEATMDIAKQALAAWREIAPAKPEEEKGS